MSSFTWLDFVVGLVFMLAIGVVFVAYAAVLVELDKREKKSSKTASTVKFFWKLLGVAVAALVLVIECSWLGSFIVDFLRGA